MFSNVRGDVTVSVCACDFAPDHVYGWPSLSRQPILPRHHFCVGLLLFLLVLRNQFLSRLEGKSGASLGSGLFGSHSN